MIEDDWMVADAMLTLAQGCADVASTGQLAKAWQMWEDEGFEAQGEGGQGGSGAVLALTLGDQSALFGGSDSNSLKKAMNIKGANVGFTAPIPVCTVWQPPPVWQPPAAPSRS